MLVDEKLAKQTKLDEETSKNLDFNASEEKTPTPSDGPQTEEKTPTPSDGPQTEEKTQEIPKNTSE